jgi:predicted ester cyclase
MMSGTNTGDVPGMEATGKKYSLEVASIIEISEGKISRETNYSNGSSLLRQLGWLPGAPATGMGKLVLKLITKRQ